LAWYSAWSARVISVAGEASAATTSQRTVLRLMRYLTPDGAISEDDEKRQAGEVQKATDQHIAEIDGVLATKEKEIMQV